MKQKSLVIDAIQNTSNFNYCLLDALAKEKINLVYATTEFAYESMPVPPGVKIFPCFFYLARLANRFIKFRPLRRFLRGAEYPLDLLILLIYILHNRIKVVHVMYIVAGWLDSRFLKLLQCFGCRVVFTAHNPMPRERRQRKDIQRLSRIYRSVDHIIVLTHHAGKELQINFDVPSAKITVIPHGDYNSLFSQYSLNEALAQAVRKKAAGRRIITFLGIIRPYKGLDYFIEAFPLIKKRLPDSFFLIAGSVLIGPKKDLKKKLAHSCSAEDLWADIRFIPVEDMKAYLSVTDVLVQPYVNASQSGNTVMAYAAGIPVISTDVGGLAEMTEDGKTGYIIPPKDPPALAEALAKCFRKDNYNILSKNARRVAKEKYNWRKIAQKTTQLYQHLTNIN